MGGPPRRVVTQRTTLEATEALPVKYSRPEAAQPRHPPSASRARPTVTGARCSALAQRPQDSSAAPATPSCRCSTRRLKRQRTGTRGGGIRARMGRAKQRSGIAVREGRVHLAVWTAPELVAGSWTSRQRGPAAAQNAVGAPTRIGATRSRPGPIPARGSRAATRRSVRARP